jgi:glycosyltransferase involved in cell wall biosynthesis
VNHVAYLVPTIDRIGGAEQQVILLAKGLAGRGWQVSVLALAGVGGDAARGLKQAGVAYHSLEMRKGLADPRGWLRLRAWVEQNHPDVLHAHLPHASLLARYLRIAMPVRVFVDTIHSPATGGSARRFGYRLTKRQPDAITAVSHAAAHPWVRAGLVNTGSLSVIPNGIDTDRWKRDHRARAYMRKKLGLTDEFLWLAVGRLDPVKDDATLLKSFARLSPHTRLVIAGSGPLQSELRTLATQLWLYDRVTFAGFQNNILQWMQAADGFVLCSLWEGLPMALLEACACEVPAVITDIPGAREALPVSRCNTAARVGDPESLASAMSALMLLPEAERLEIGRQARASIRSTFSLDPVLFQWESLFQNLLTENPQPTRFGKLTSAPTETFQFNS